MRSITHRIIFVLLVFSIIGADNAHCLTTTYKLPPTTSTTDFQMLLVNLLHWMLSVIGPIALIMLIIAGMMHITSAGDPQKAASAKKVYMAMAGLIIALLSYSMLVLLNNMFT